jgi:hypothetical protein
MRRPPQETRSPTSPPSGLGICRHVDSPNGREESPPPLKLLSPTAAGHVNKRPLISFQHAAPTVRQTPCPYGGRQSAPTRCCWRRRPWRTPPSTGGVRGQNRVPSTRISSHSSLYYVLSLIPRYPGEGSASSGRHRWERARRRRGRQSLMGERFSLSVDVTWSSRGGSGAVGARTADPFILRSLSTRLSNT